AQRARLGRHRRGGRPGTACPGAPRYPRRPGGAHPAGPRGQPRRRAAALRRLAAAAVPAQHVQRAKPAARQRPLPRPYLD
nr:hypothetical protein [Tanacetum cinerariifolium]